MIEASHRRRQRSDALTAALALIDDLDDDELDTITPESDWLPGASALAQYEAAPPVRDRRPSAPDREANRAPHAHRRARWWAHGDADDLERLADSLPLTIPPGYARDSRGVWRYTATNARVPGAKDRTLGSTYRPARRADLATMARPLVRVTDELHWMFDVEQPTDDPTVVAVEWQVWEALGQRPVGIVAPELTHDRLWDVDKAAIYLGVSTATIWSYRSRDNFPEPVAVLGQTPVWSQPLIVAWDAARPGQGARKDLGSRRRKVRRSG